MTRKDLGRMVRLHRDRHGLTQEALAEQTGIPGGRSDIAHLEQGSRILRAEFLERVANVLGIPDDYWRPFAREEALLRFEFEDSLSEMVGEAVSIAAQDRASEAVVERKIGKLFGQSLSGTQTLDLLNSIAVFYGVRPLSREFFVHYLKPAAFASPASFRAAIETYQLDAIRLFVSLREAFRALNSSVSLTDVLRPLRERDLSNYHERGDWMIAHQLEEERLPDLGYISAKRVRQEQNERAFLARFLRDTAAQVDARGTVALADLSEKTARKVDSLLRKFGSTIAHGVTSPLFAPDADAMRREAERLGPKSEAELARMEETQARALENLAHYLSSDHLDVYVATSMRTDADFVSVNRFVQGLFNHEAVRPLKLRYFNPTQSWIEDRIAKGLVEALMLKRASVTVYMAQKSDTFGKDSEASVALGQGKPVIVYVPKLWLEGIVDLESLFKTSRPELLAQARRELGDADDGIDETVDDEAIVGRIATAKVSRLADEQLTELVRASWADFDLYGEAERFDTEAGKAAYREWLDAVVAGGTPSVPPEMRFRLVGALVATGIRMENRAKVFMEIHPLALQIILSTGVLNGIVVVRTAHQCARVLEALIRNGLVLRLVKDDQNYRVVDTETGSTIRVISRHELLRNAFDTYYSATALRGEVDSVA